MKRLIYSLLALSASILALSSCQDVIDLKTEAGPTQLVVDGWITDQGATQRIKLSLSAGYFDNSAVKPALGAKVTVSSGSAVYEFKDLKNDGNYVWSATNGKSFAKVGETYKLNIQYGGDTYEAQSAMKRVPPIDSIAYEYKERTAVPDDAPKSGYLAEFYANDPVGPGDCYWIKHYKNGKLYNKADEITIAYDGAFSVGSASDGFMFILPIRQAITSRNTLDLYAEKDTLKVELYSISLEAFYFLFQVQQESTNQGLFATAPSNIPTNVINTNPTGKKALGFFGVSAVSTLQTVIDAKKARPTKSGFR
ncbi:MAG: DUF4249 domain-containing protein [Spirosomataceae bacterium]